MYIYNTRAPRGGEYKKEEYLKLFFHFSYPLLIAQPPEKREDTVGKWVIYIQKKVPELMPYH